MPKYHRVVIVGVGLLGGSIGLALRQRGLAETIVGVGRTEKSLLLAQEIGAITEFTLDPKIAFHSADLVVIGTPVQTIAGYVTECCSSSLAKNCLVTDVGSTKVKICSQLPQSVHDHFCGSHPMAGSEKTGVSFARHGLFEGRTTIITPTPQTPAGTVDRIRTLWASLGSEVVLMSPEEHDRAVANISHLPHVVSAALASCTDKALLRITGDGWRDTTRIAGGDIELWQQIVSENRDSIAFELRKYASKLNGWLQAVESNDQSQIEELLRQGKVMRDAYALLGELEKQKT